MCYSALIGVVECMILLCSLLAHDPLLMAAYNLPVKTLVATSLGYQIQVKLNDWVNLSEPHIDNTCVHEICDVYEICGVYIIVLCLARYCL